MSWALARIIHYKEGYITNPRVSGRDELVSLDLKQLLRKVVEEDYDSEVEEIERGIDRYKALILEIAKVKRFDIAIWVEGSDTRFRRDERDLSFLERANLVKGEMNFTRDSHNAYREYTLTKKGAELATKLVNEKTGTSTESQWHA